MKEKKKKHKKQQDHKEHKNQHDYRAVSKFQAPFSYIGPNPKTTFNTVCISPNLHESVHVGPFVSVIGDVTIAENVYLAPHVSIRVDEGTPFFIGSDTNLQDGVTLHGLAHGRVTHDGKEYSIYIGNRVSCAHGAVIHGPCAIGDDVFVGFNAIVLNACIEDGCYIGHGAYVTGGIRVPAGRYIAPNMTVDTQEAADGLPPIEESQKEFAEEVITVNCEFPKSYAEIAGNPQTDAESESSGGTEE
jgi:carbon dioxide concentrating mechanism protein CcmM